MTPALPHGPGFRWIDDVQVDAAERRARGRKYLDPALPVFRDHFPDEAVFPGVLMVEAAAQTAGALWAAVTGATETDSPPRFAVAAIREFKFAAPARPGACLDIEAVLERELGGLAQFSCRITTGGALIAAGAVVLARPPRAA